MTALRSRLLGPDGRPLPRPAPTVRVRGRYDAAQTHSESARHWKNADSLSARAANTLAVRQVLRDRARYESSNNSYCRGLVLTLANDLIGTGPRLQLLTDDDTLNRAVEQAFAGWATAIDLAGKLQVMVQAKKVDGEPFAFFTDNPRLANPVKLDVQPVECDRISAPDPTVETPNEVDGIRFDRFGNPTEYYLLDEAPGDELGEAWRRPQHLWDTGWYVIRPVNSFLVPRPGRWLPARDVLHWFRADRPGQVRGVPEITPALPLFAQLRRYTLAVIASAETNADFAVMLESTLEPDRELDAEAMPFDMKEIDPRMMVALPTGYKAYQLKAEQPATTYAMFKQEILAEIARCLNVPSNLAAGNFNQASYASGRLDYQLYRMALRVERAGIELLLHRIFRAWFAEAVLVPELLPRGVELADLRVGWFWDGWQYTDPVKEAQASEIELRNNLTTRAEKYGDRGLDYEEQLRQAAKEKQLMAELGLSGAAAPAGPQVLQPDEEEEEEGAHATA